MLTLGEIRRPGIVGSYQRDHGGEREPVPLNGRGRGNTRRRQIPGGVALIIQSIELRRIPLPLVTPFRTSQYTEYERNLLILQLHTAEGRGGDSRFVLGQ
jgi:hypothetical protein